MFVHTEGAGERHGPAEEAAGGAGGHEAPLPSNRGEGGGAAGPSGAGRHQERAQQVRKTFQCGGSKVRRSEPTPAGTLEIK